MGQETSEQRVAVVAVVQQLPISRKRAKNTGPAPLAPTTYVPRSSFETVSGNGHKPKSGNDALGVHTTPPLSLHSAALVW